MLYIHDAFASLNVLKLYLSDAFLASRNVSTSMFSQVDLKIGVDMDTKMYRKD